jgi:arsenate reductase
MTKGLVKTLYPDRYEVFSAGTEPSGVNPYAIKVMAEIGIDISRNRAKHLNEFLNTEFDYVVTVCDHAKQVCPFFTGGKALMHKGFQDPAAFGGSDQEKIAVFRRVRDEIRDWIGETFFRGGGAVGSEYL